MKSPIDAARAYLAAGAKPTQADLKAAISSLEQHVQEADADLERLAESRETLLIGSTFAKVAAADEEIRAANFRRDQALAIINKLSAALAEVAEADRAALILSQRRAVEALMKKSTAAQKEWPHLVDAVRTVLRAVAEADAAAEAFERAHPDEDKIVRAEARVRAEAPTRDMIAQTEVWAWRFDDGRLTDAPSRPVLLVPEQARREPGHIARRANRNVLAEIAAGEFKVERGMIFKTQFGEGEVVVPVRAIRREFAVSTPTRPDALATDTKLPPLRGGDLGWDVERSDPDLVLAALNAAPRPRSAPRIEVELQAIGEAPAKVLQLPSAAKAA